MDFEIVGEISDVEIIAVSSGITDIARLRRYEAHGIGKREIKRKRYLD
jgi:hypothetical protein